MVKITWEKAPSVRGPAMSSPLRSWHRGSIPGMVLSSPGESCSFSALIGFYHVICLHHVTVLLLIQLTPLWNGTLWGAVRHHILSLMWGCDFLPDNLAQQDPSPSCSRRQWQGPLSSYSSVPRSNHHNSHRLGAKVPSVCKKTSPLWRQKWI